MIPLACLGVSGGRYGGLAPRPIISNLEFCMKRMKVSKGASASKFRNAVGRTKRINISPTPMRGGIRL